jgi:uncharacterized protein (TIGR00296 family)
VNSGSPPATESLAFGEAAVHLARRTLDELLPESERPVPGPPDAGSDPLAARRGVFVTLLEHPSEDLRGCIGFPLPHYPLRIGIPQAARAAALEDPRFPRLRPRELDRIVIEVSVLTLPEPIPVPGPEDRPRGVVIGQHGLIVESEGASGLLLPQVAPEQGWDAVQFLDGTCQKAGLRRGAWRRAEVTVERFEARIFRELKPRGPVVARATD